jgi:hypothetical protein
VRIEHAFSSAVELQTVIAAFDGVVLNAAEMKRNEAMGTPVLEGDGGSICEPVKHNGFFEQCATQHFAGLHFVAPTCDVPCIPEVGHFRLLVI